jgi:hypothetical protein
VTTTKMVIQNVTGKSTVRSIRSDAVDAALALLFLFQESGLAEETIDLAKHFEGYVRDICYIAQSVRSRYRRITEQLLSVTSFVAHGDNARRSKIRDPEPHNIESPNEYGFHSVIATRKGNLMQR